MAKELPVFDCVGTPKRALLPVFALLFAAMLSTVPFNAQQLKLKFVSMGLLSEQLNISLGIDSGVNSVWAAAMDNNRIQSFITANPDIAYLSTDTSVSIVDKHMLPNVTETNDDQSNLPSVVWARATYIHNGYFQLSAFTCPLVVDQICSYLFTLY